MIVDTLPPPKPRPEPYPHPEAWTIRGGVELTDAEGRPVFPVRHLFTRVDVLERDTLGLRVSCSPCESATGYVEEHDLIAASLPPEVSAWGELAEFLHAVREAAMYRDLLALLPVMAPDFSFSFIGPQNPHAAIDFWRSEGFRSLEALPELLDQGVVTGDGRIWSAPPAFVQDLRYQGLRAGFRRRADGRWEWIYLIRGIS